MNQKAFTEAASEASSWASLKKDFDGGLQDAAWYRVGQTVYFAAEPKGAAISPLWLLTATRASKGALKGVEVQTNYRANVQSRSPSEIGIMKLALDGLPKIARAAKAPAEAPAEKVVRVTLTDQLVGVLESRFKVPAEKRTIVNDIMSISASIKDKETGVYGASGTQTVHRLYLATAYILLAQKHSAKTKDGVVALVVDKTGNIVSWGMKNPEVSCWHGETSALMRLRGRIPEGGCVFSTLKPCKMCGGLVSDASSKKAGAFYGQDDTGKDAEKTALDTDKHNFPLDQHKGPQLPRGLMVTAGDAKGRVAMGDQLQTQFAAQQTVKGGIGSPIDYVTSTAAEDLMKATKAMFAAKVQKYQAQVTPNLRNQNTRSAVEYLAAFLESQGVKVG